MIKVIIADGEFLVCSIIAATLESYDEIEVVASVTSVEDAIARADGCTLILASTQLPDRGALAILQSVHQQELDVKVVVMGVGHLEAEILTYIEAGADAIVLRGADADDLVEQIRHAANGTADLSPKVARTLMERAAELVRKCEDLGIDVGGVAELTQREQEVLECIAAGMTNAEIADHLFIEVGTAKNHVHNILRKLNASSREEAAIHLGATRSEQESPSGDLGL